MTAAWGQIRDCYANRGPWFDRMVALIYFALLFVGSAAIHVLGCGNQFHLFGWEYGNIAESLVRGEGFAGAMAHGSGPTAWMPPVPVWINALIFLLLGVRTNAAVAAAYTLKAAGMALALHIQLGIWRDSRWPGKRWPLYFLAFLFVALNPFRMFLALDDMWIVNLTACLAVQALLALYREGGRLAPSLTVLSLALPLTWPVSAAAFHACNLVLGLKAIGQRRPWRAHALALLLSLSVTGAWTARNALALGQAYPVKSNMWFEFVQANLWDDDGVLTDSDFNHNNPVIPNAGQERYLRLGERGFVEACRQESQKIPTSQWLKRCGRRLFDIAIFMEPEGDEVFVRGSLSEADLGQLHAVGLVKWYRGQPRWQYCGWDEAALRPSLRDLPLEDRAGVVRSRQVAVAEFEERYFGLWRIWGLAHALLVTLAIAATLGSPRTRSDPVAIVTIAFYCLYQIPYLLISHYERYQVSIMGVLALLITLGWCALSPFSEPEAGPADQV